MARSSKPSTRKPAARPKKTAAHEPVLEQVPEITDTGKIEHPSDRVIKLDNLGRMSSKDAAALLRISDRTLRNWRKEGCMSIFDGGAVDVGGVWAWRENKIIAEAEQDKANIIEAKGGLSLAEVQVRHEIAKARMTEIKLERELGMLLPRDVYIHALSTLLSDISSRLHTMPRKISPLVAVESDRGECERIIMEKVEDMLALLMVDIAMNLERTKVDPFEEADREAAAEADEAEDADR